MDEQPGFGFWAKLAGALLVGGIALFIVLAIFLRLVYAWGVLGAFFVIAGIAILYGWWWDRREAKPL